MTYKYLLSRPSDLRWGIVTRTVGGQDVQPGEPYPTGEHPTGYHFSPQTGRRLRETQILYITRGSGWFCSEQIQNSKFNNQKALPLGARGKEQGAREYQTVSSSPCNPLAPCPLSLVPKIPLRAGDAVILYPGEWHSYAPDPATGWTEAWIGFTGDDAQELLRKYFPQGRENPIVHVGISATLRDAFRRACEVADRQWPAYQQELAGYVCLIVTTLYARSQQMPFRGNPDTEGLEAAVAFMRQSLGQNLSMEQVAREAGMGYSKFRSLFKSYTGFSPAQYFLRLKMERAKDYLLGSHLAVGEIAWRLGFDSASHFCKMFRLSCGTSPAEFRGKLKR